MEIALDPARRLDVADVAEQIEFQRRFAQAERGRSHQFRDFLATLAVATGKVEAEAQVRQDQLMIGL